MRGLLILIAALMGLSSGTAEARWGRHHHHFQRIERGLVVEGRWVRQYRPTERVERNNVERGAAQGDPRDIATLVPANWQLQPPDPNWTGRRFLSPDGQSWLAFYASPADKNALNQHLKSVAFVDGEELTFLQRDPDRLVVSGFKGDRSFFRKVALACGGQLWQQVAIEFPTVTKRAFEPLVERLSRALDLTASDCNPVVGRN